MDDKNNLASVDENSTVMDTSITPERSLGDILNSGLQQALQGMNRAQRRRAMKEHELKVRKILKNMHQSLRKIAKNNQNAAEGPLVEETPSE